MRIATTQYHSTMNTAMHTAQARLEKVMQQMATAQRVQLPSDDPIAAVRLSRLAREEAALAQYRDNIAALGVRLRQNEVYLDSIGRDMLHMRDLVVWAADGANTSADVNAMAHSLVSLRDSVFATANGRDQEGRYVFSGTAVGSPAISYDDLAAPGARYSFTGNAGVQHVVVGNGFTQPANMTLEEMADFLNQLDLSIASLSAPGVNVNDPTVRAELTTTFERLDATLNAVTAKIAVIGGAMNTLDTLDGTHANVSLSNKHATLALGQLDYGDAAVKLNGYSTALQATQKAYVRVTGLSLFDLI
jgi:flagellar hook-associated protein 3 FlgL